MPPFFFSPTDLFYVASGCTNQARTAEPTRLTLRCFCKSFNGGFNDPAHLGDLPVGNKPADGNGILINLTGQARWQPFATWMIRLLSKCLTEGTLCVEGLLNVPFVISACSLLCYGDADLHMVSGSCFTYHFSLLIYSMTLFIHFLVIIFLIC